VSPVGPFSQIDIGQVCIYPGHHVDGANEFCTLASSICGPSVPNLLHVALMAARIIEVAPRCLENLCNPDLDSKNFLLKPLLYCAVCDSVPAPWVSHFCFNVYESGNVAGKCYMCHLKGEYLPQLSL